MFGLFICVQFDAKNLLTSHFVNLLRTGVKKVGDKLDLHFCRIISMFVDRVILDSTGSCYLQKCHSFTTRSVMHVFQTTI